MAIDIKGTLGKKLGPLPVGVWIIAVGGGLGLSYYLQSNAGESEEEVAEDDPYAYEPLPYAPPNFGGGVALPDYGVGVVNPVQTRPTTNDEWLMLSVEYLISQGSNALMASNALNKYLQGSALNSQEQALVSRAIRAFGSPPDGAPTVEEPVPTPEDPPDTPQTGARWHSSTPQDVVAAFPAPSVDAVLKSLGVDYTKRGPSAIDRFDISDGLKKLGWNRLGDLAVTKTNVGRLMAKTRATTKAPVTPKWGRGIPVSVRRSKDARVQPIPVKTALMRVSINPYEYIQAGEIRAGYKKVRMTTTKVNPDKVAEFVRRTRNL